MAYLEEGYISDRPVAYAMPSERALFIRRTYAHLAGAIMAFVALEAVLIRSGVGQAFTEAVFGGGGRGGALALMIGFIGAGYLARYWARSNASPASQYLGLSLYVVAEVIIFLPILYIANTYFAGQHVIEKAGLLTLGIAAGLSMTVFITRKDFSFIGPAICVFSWVALALIAIAFIFPGFTLGTWFSFAMIGLAAACILYTTSNVLHHFTADQHVGAALELFAAIALMFWYILQLFMSRRN